MIDQFQLRRLQDEERQLLQQIDAAMDPAHASHLAMVLEATQAAIREAEWQIARATGFSAQPARRANRSAHLHSAG